jgi:hypothetical protein
VHASTSSVLSIVKSANIYGLDQGREVISDEFCKNFIAEVDVALILVGSHHYCRSKILEIKYCIVSAF